MLEPHSEQHWELDPSFACRGELMGALRSETHRDGAQRGGSRPRGA